MIKILLLAVLVFISRSELVSADSLDSLNQIITQNENVMIMFHVKWCGACQSLKPQFNALASEVQNITLVSVDITDKDTPQIDEMYKKYNFKYFPTFYAARNGITKQFKKFKMKIKAFNSFILDIGTVKYQMVSAEELAELKKTNKITVALTIDKSSEQYQTIVDIYSQLAQSITKKVKFYLVESVEVQNHHLMIQNNLIQINETYSGKWKLKEMKKFIKSNLKQLIAEYDFEKELQINHRKYTLLVILEDQEKDKQALQELHKLADQVKQTMMGDLIIRYIIKAKLSDSVMNQLYDQIGELSGLPKEMIPNILLLHDSPEQEQLYKIDGEVTAQNILYALKKAKAGTLERIFKTEPIPEEQDKYVHKLVYSTFDDYLDKTDKDVLIYFYADWCGFCKKFTPEYEQIAEKWSKTHPNIQFTKYNADQNDYVYEIQGFPTLVYYQHKSEMFNQLKGQRTEENILKQIEELSNETEEQDRKEDL